MVRLPDWPERLAAYIEARRHLPFAWGSNDCVLFPADGLLAMTGSDPLGSLRGAWASEEQAQAELARHGGLLQAARALLGDPLPRPLLAHRGAPVLARMQAADGEITAMGLAMGDTWCTPGPEGLVFRPAAEVRLAWGV